MTPPTNAVKRACDACHRRKVKCDGVNPCRNCTIAQLSCTYNAIPQKKGPKGSRAKVITELRESQRQTSLAARVHNRLGGHNPPPSQNPTLNPSSGLMTSEFVKECLGFYFENLYPKAPIIDRTTIQASIPYMEQDRDVYCLLTSLCAFVMLQPGMSMPSANDPYNFSMNPGSNVVAAQILLEEAQRVRKGYEYMECTNLNTIATCVFLACSLAMLEYQDKAWVEIRKATTLINIANLHTEEAYTSLGTAEAPRARRLFWMLYVMERSFAFSRGRPVTLQSSIHPLTNADGDLIQLNGFLTLVNTYRPLSSAILSTWNQARKTLNAQHITALSSQLSDTAEQIRSQDPTAMDLGVNQNWLKDLIWRLSPTGRSNSQGSADGMMGYPVEAARELLFTLSSQFSGRGMELMMHGGLMKTLMETLSNMLNLAPFLPHSRAPFRMGPREYLDELISIVAVVRVGAHQFLPLLFQKTGEVLPRVASAALDEAPEDLNALANMANVDMFDGFGTAGMAQVPQMHMSMSMDAQHTTMMPMEGPIQAPMQMVTDQHTPPHNHFDNNHSSPAMQLPLDNQSTASMIKMEPQQTPQMQMQMQLPMDNRRLSHQQQQSPQHQHQQQQQQQQMQMQMGLGTMVEGMEFQTPYAVDEYGIPVENSFGGLQGDQSMRAPMQQRSMSIQGPMQEEMQSDLPGDMQAINGMNSMTNLNMNGMMQISQNMMANEQHRHGFWS